MARKVRFFGLILAISFIFSLARAADEELKVIETAAEKDAQVQVKNPEQLQKLVKADIKLDTKYMDPMLYTLGPEDTVEVTVMRHPEFSGTFPINLEGKLQYKFVGDIDVTGLTKKELEQKIKEIISAFVVNPEVNVTVLEYKSKVIYVLGEVATPGKYYIRSESIPVREAVVNAGLPTYAAAMRKCRIITPDKNGRVKTRAVDLYSVLYGGNLRNNIDMHPGDVLYVPATVMAKVIRIINPVASTVGIAASGPESASTAKSSITSLAK